MRRMLITEILKELLSTPEGRKRFAQSVTEFMNRPLRKLKPIDWSKVSFKGVKIR